MAKAKPLPQVWDEGTVWLKTVDAKRNVSHTEHRCWNMAGFVSKVCVAALETGGIAEQISEADYRKATK